MVPVICIVGQKKSGKTLLIERLIPELKALGYRIGTIKHHHHRTDLDVEGKDSWRHAQAGAEVVAISSPLQLVVFRRVKGEMTLEEIVPLLGDMDLILAEGYKASPNPKIEVHRATLSSELLCGREDHLIALVSDRPWELGVPCFRWEEVPALAAFIEGQFLKGYEPSAVSYQPQATHLPREE